MDIRKIGCFMIIGLTGTLGSGKGMLGDYFRKKGFIYLSLSDELREIARENSIILTRENLQNLGNKLRQDKGPGFLAKRVVDKINNQKYDKVIIDGIRNPGEIEELKTLKSFSLVSVDSPQEIRFRRLVTRNRESDPKTWEDFLRVDARDQGFGESSSGQAVLRCMILADFKISNESTQEEFEKKAEELYDQIDRKTPRPTWDEYFMEISRAVARRATCNRGRAGCVIVKDKRIIVTGYVGSPKGLPHCDEVGHQMKTLTHEDGSQSQHCVRTTHAEQNAICQAAKIGVSIDGATVYCNMTPCSTCAKMIINAGIIKVVCDKKCHAGKESEEMFKKAGVELEILKDEILAYKNQ